LASANRHHLGEQRLCIYFGVGPMLSQKPIPFVARLAPVSKTAFLRLLIEFGFGSANDATANDFGILSGHEDSLQQGKASRPPTMDSRKIVA
jgi:hypothetical protein